MTPVNFFLWVLLKGMVFKIKPCTVDDLKRSITNETTEIPPTILDANICEHGELCQPDSPGRRKLISTSNSFHTYQGIYSPSFLSSVNYCTIYTIRWASSK
jgi:hypothetical protein